MNRDYRVALICGILPLFIGVSIFVLWLITSWNWLMLAGIFTLSGGSAAFLLGILALTRYCSRAFRTPVGPSRRLWLSTLGSAGLLLLNLPVAGGITLAVIAIETRYTVIVHNASQHRLDGARVFGGGCEASFPTIPPGGVARCSFRIQHDGELEFRASSGSTTHAITIDSYVTNNAGGRTTIMINPDGKDFGRGDSAIPTGARRLRRPWRRSLSASKDDAWPRSAASSIPQPSAPSRKRGSARSRRHGRNTEGRDSLGGSQPHPREQAGRATAGAGS